MRPSSHIWRHTMVWFCHAWWKFLSICYLVLDFTSRKYSSLECYVTIKNTWYLLFIMQKYFWGYLLPTCFQKFIKIISKSVKSLCAKGEEMDNVYVGGYNNKQQICISSSSFFQIFHKKPIMGVHLVHHSDVKQILKLRLTSLIRFLFFIAISALKVFMNL